MRADQESQTIPFPAVYGPTTERTRGHIRRLRRILASVRLPTLFTVLASLHILAILLGLGVGALTATVLSLVFWLALTTVGFEDAALAGLTVALLIGLVVGGYAAGRMAIVSHRFHGSVTGLVIAALVLVIARFGGSPAPTAQVLWLALLGVVLGGLGGAIAGRRQKA